LKARDDLGLTVPMVGLAKRHELLYVPVETDEVLRSGSLEVEVVAAETDLLNGETPEATLAGLANTPATLKASRSYNYDKPALRTYTYREIELPLNSPGLLLLRKLRDEAHRFALSYHRKLRDKKVGGSSLDEIPGVGPRRKRLLLRTFGSIERIRRASVDEIAAVPTLTKAVAVKIKDYLAEA